MADVVYIYLKPGAGLPDLSSHNVFKTVFISNRSTDTAFKAMLAGELIQTGCRYFMATGEDCRAWQDAVNLANLQAFNYGTIPDREIVIATAHPDEELRDVFWFCTYTAMHPCFDIETTVLIDLNINEREQELIRLFNAA